LFNYLTLKKTPLYSLSLKRERKEQKMHSLKKWFKPLYHQFPSLQGEGQQKRTNTISFNRERCSGDCLVILAVGKNLSPSSPLLEERGQGAEMHSF